MTVFLSYTREEARLAESLAAHLNALGIRILAFEDIELVDDKLDYLRECNSVCVLYSRNSRITHSVRLANRMIRRQLSGMVFIDEDWDADEPSLDVFASFFRRRVRFDYLSVTRALKALVALLAKTPPLPKGFEVFEALLVEPRSEAEPTSVISHDVRSGRPLTSEELLRALLARGRAEGLHGKRLRPDLARVLGQPGRKVSKPPDDVVAGGIHALLEAIEAQRMRHSAPRAQPGEPASDSAVLGGQDRDQIPDQPPPPKKD